MVSLHNAFIDGLDLEAYPFAIPFSIFLFSSHEITIKVRVWGFSLPLSIRWKMLGPFPSCQYSECVP